MTKSDQWQATRIDMKLKDRPCASCGIVVPMLASRRYCPTCSSIKKSENAKRAWRLGNLKKIKPDHTCMCVICEKQFIGHPNNKTCSKECRSEKNRRYALDFSRSQAGVEKARRTALMNKYGLTLEDKEAMILSQSGKCPICRKELGEFSKSHVDHDHSTGKVRSVLCSLCNVGLGAFMDSVANLNAAAEYINKHDNL